MCKHFWHFSLFNEYIKTGTYCYVSVVSRHLINHNGNGDPHPKPNGESHRNNERYSKDQRGQSWEQAGVNQQI